MSLKETTVFKSAEFEKSLQTEVHPLSVFRKALERGQHVIRADHFNQGDPVQTVAMHAWLVDELLIHAWDLHRAQSTNLKDIALVAVGGYGRSELHPASDIDLMILMTRQTDEIGKFIETFIQFLWDMGLEVGHSTRSLQDCVREAKSDITVATNLMESRLLTGNTALFGRMKQATDAPRLWPDKKFFSAKLEEQHHRHIRYGDTAYNLEPNIKEGIGGLRDIQTILWVAQRHFHSRSLDALVKHNFLGKQEYKLLIEGRNFLWKVRNSLHYMAGRREDRLLFDYQNKLAEEFGFSDDKDSLAVEKLMKLYYRTVKELSIVNDILLQHFDETILSRNNPREGKINERFRSLGGYLSIINDNTFSDEPGTLLELFLLLEKHPKLKGVRARTIRLLRANLHRIDDDFRTNPDNIRLFMEIMRQPAGITHVLRRMNDYGVLGAYIPAFGKIVGQMQHDLFHVYTVDEHTLFVVRNLRRLTVLEFKHELPLASSIIAHLLKPERLYIAGLFHDIAKGRGGDHSELGAAEAGKFCLQHKLSDYDATLVSWLVKNHLLMSWVSQRQDISDPDVVNKFAQSVGDQEHLDNLYLLTVSDIRGTSPTIWNEWKAHLLIQLYRDTSRLFALGVDSKLDARDSIEQRKNGALELLGFALKTRTLLTRFWNGMDNSYFLGYEPNSLAWHATTIVTRSAAEIPLVATRFNPEIGSTEFLFYTSVKSDVLIKLTGAFDRQNLSIVDARIHTSQQGFMLTTFVILDVNGKAIKNSKMLAGLEEVFLDELLSETPAPSLLSQRLSRQLKHFPIETKISFSESANNATTTMEVITQDRPGLLYQVTSALYLCRIKLIAAKISTFGERAEDIFFIADQNDEAIKDNKLLDKLKNAIYLRLQPDSKKIKRLNF
ncbi:MAG: [protein-PII] uridylyltransferase [Gammaproteobacteria bacterium]|nr:MAG: [protein-PII] uridylyltransferase [Gammaproteobacteria bacterium]